MRNPYGERRTGGNEYAASVAMLRRGYGYLLAPANEQHLPDSVVTLRRLDQLLMNLLFLESIFINRATLNGTRPNSP
jgi:hypothetical protein